MSVTAPQGFEAAGVAAGLKTTGKPDVAVVVNRGPLKAGAAVFTSNRAKANPILWSEVAVRDGVVEAVDSFYAAVRKLEIPSLDLEALVCVELAGACAADAVKDARVAEL